VNAEIKELLKPEILNTVSGLELIARIVVEGFMSGSNKSQTIGSGQEFSQYRTYEPGDDLRQLDWKMYARSERYYIKQAEIETNITVKFILDASESMGYAENGISKLMYAKVMTAALAYLARKQSDTFGLFTVNDKTLTAIQPRFEQQQFIRFLNALVNLQTEGTWKRDNGLEGLFDHHGKEMILFFTDLYDEDADLLKFISRLKTPRNEVITFHLMGKNEMDLAFNGSFTFEDLETHSRIKVDTALQQKQYSDHVNKWVQKSRMWMLERHINYELVQMNNSFEQSLRNFLRVRKTILR
jgi:uncharacterized protein (DUF58 family)